MSKHMLETGFTDREKQVSELLIEGLNNEEIGDRLFISINTVKFHLRNIYFKLEVHNRAQACVKLINGTVHNTHKS